MKEYKVGERVTVVDPTTYTCTQGTIVGQTKFHLRLDVVGPEGKHQNIQINKLKHFVKPYDEQIYQALLNTTVEIRKAILRFHKLIG